MNRIFRNKINTAKRSTGPADDLLY